ncbi:hypothetical protein [Burkholderia ambifaria]|uniref:Uncharacterized protein n=1 Tax=Burkholderia ambifaria TaxID=152480 RepID=A0AA41JJF9_9BURK|nr:hypothetical protein [Burkholderia ambifaria]MBR8129325.1 hypothetical protein [Burkholderia ambifaria]
MVDVKEELHGGVVRSFRVCVRRSRPNGGAPARDGHRGRVAAAPPHEFEPFL